MSARDKAQGTPRCSSSLSSSTSEGKHRDKNPMDSKAKRRKAASTLVCNSQPPPTACASQPSAHPLVAGPSGVNIPAASPPPDAELGCLSSLLNGLIEKLDMSAAPQVSPGYSASFSGFHDLSSSEDEDVEIVECPSQ